MARSTTKRAASRSQRSKTKHTAAILHTVKLERFKAAFRPDPLSFAPLTVLIGRNGSGKSTVLEALQWLDLTMRHDAAQACERTTGIHDLINIRSRGKTTKYFKIELTWRLFSRNASPDAKATYCIRVNEATDGGPLIHSESLWVTPTNGRPLPIIWTEREGDWTHPGRRVVLPEDVDRKNIFDAPDRLALCRLRPQAEGENLAESTLMALASFWDRIVFLRLSPRRISLGSPPRRTSLEPLLDEEGQLLPALLNDLSDVQQAALVRALNEALPDVKKITVPKTDAAREQNVSWSIRERMPLGQGGKETYEIPASLLSEGTRRLTAIMALLIRQPPPSLLCIEEIENSLDPWTTLKVLAKLQAASHQGTQVMITSHSPWLLDHVDLDAVRLARRSEGNTRYSTFSSEQAILKFPSTVPPGTRYVNMMEQED